MLHGVAVSYFTNNLAGGASASASEPVNLAVAITPEAMIPILANQEVQQRLIPHLPDGASLPKNEEELRKTISTPQFQQAMQSFSAALGSGQLGPLMGQFGLGEAATAAATAGGTISTPSTTFAMNHEYICISKTSVV